MCPALAKETNHWASMSALAAKSASTTCSWARLTCWTRHDVGTRQPPKKIETCFQHVYIHTYKHTYIQTYIHTNIHTYKHTYIHTCKSIHTYFFLYLYIHLTPTHPYIYLYIYISTYVYIYICMYVFIIYFIVPGFAFFNRSFGTIHSRLQLKGFERGPDCWKDHLTEQAPITRRNHPMKIHVIKNKSHPANNPCMRNDKRW